MVDLKSLSYDDIVKLKGDIYEELARRTRDMEIERWEKVLKALNDYLEIAQIRVVCEDSYFDNVIMAISSDDIGELRIR